MDLELILKKMKVQNLKQEISKQNIKGYSKLKKADLIKLMLSRPERFEHLLISNLKQKKELLEDKVKLKGAKDKLKKIVSFEPVKGKATKKSRVPQQATVIKPVKKTALIPAVIPAVTPDVKLSKNEIILDKLKQKQQVLEQKLKSSNKKNRLDINSQLLEVKMQVYEIEDKIIGQSDKNKEQKLKQEAVLEKQKLKIFVKLVMQFIKNPTSDLLALIDDDFEMIDDLDEKLQDKLETEIAKFNIKG